jgi:hypothetical protein
MTMRPGFVPLTGGCRCGKLRFRMDAAPIITHCCHCRLCQRFSGTPFRVNAMIETDQLQILEGAPETFQGVGTDKQLQCPGCRSVLWSHHPELGDALAFVGVGSLDHGERLPPEAHYFTRSKHPWVTLSPDLPAFQELGDPGKPGVRERIESALASAGAAVPAPDWVQTSPSTDRAG